VTLHPQEMVTTATVTAGESRQNGPLNGPGIVIDLNAPDPAGIVTVHQPIDVTRLGLGQPVMVGLTLCRTMFAICPMSHRVAFLGAVEAARGATAPHAVQMARTQAVAAEALAACVWRHCITLAGLAGQVPDTDSAKTARLSAARYSASLFDGDQPVAAEAVDVDARQALCDLVIASHDVARSYIDRCPDITISDRCAPLGRDVFNPDVRTDMQREETPLAIEAGADDTAHLSAWLYAQLRMAVGTAYALRAGTIPVLGPGMVQTSRGRLTHRVGVDDAGQIASWDITAPTDWNFAASGPAARALAGCRHTAHADWIVAAFDPCWGHHVRGQATGRVTERRNGGACHA